MGVDSKNEVLRRSAALDDDNMVNFGASIREMPSDGESSA